MKIIALLRPLSVLFAVLVLVTGLAYPGVVTLIGRLAFPSQVAGSLIVEDGAVRGSALIGQSFQDPKYFWGRLSATAPMPYNGLASGGSNFGPSNPALAEAVRGRLAALRAADPAQQGPVPVDLVTASGSGLDPQISPAAALYQVSRVAAARGMDVAAVRRLVADSVERPQWHVLGEARVNVLLLNLRLDHAQ